MAQPAQSDLQNNVFAFEGQPFVAAGVATATTDNNLFAFEGSPFVAPYAAAALSTERVFLSTPIFG